jgi:hypothetical protein
MTTLFSYHEIQRHREQRKCSIARSNKHIRDTEQSMKKDGQELEKYKIGELINYKKTNTRTCTIM